ncbi:S-adenosyl-L-methionine-dependent methyltransferase [Rhizophagus irregularis]|uniref:S-adenosyl-L-methionine-dependent methyltransferase n=1 Tax=Rhizophagus irregularis TaxID=588596 RepID=A0A2N1NGE3_9GLOM|nr:S-adenosyl-L-methionine-dependent methyltransferase [Rhizophagus irregularis]
MGNCFCKPKSKRKPKPYRMPTSTIGSPISDTHLIISDVLDYGSNDEYRFIDGRRFHNVINSKYFLPCDDDEFDRLHIKHYICKHIWQRNYSAPVKERLSSGGAHVLDVGCGPGTWLIEMANEFPKSHFTGMDITPVFPRESKPDNADFMEANILDGLPFEDNVFDYVHMRFLITSFSANDWKIAINEIVRVTKSGGIIELVEEELEPRKDGPISRLLFSALFMDLTSRNIEFTIYSHMIDLLNDIESLTDIKKEEIMASYGKWAGRIGSLLSDNTGLLFRTFKTRFLTTLGVENEVEYDKLIEAWYEELNEYKPYNVGYRFLATKK